MRRIYLLWGVWLCLLIPQLTPAQNPGDFWNGLDTTNVQDYKTVMDNIFGNLNASWYPSGLLINRTLGLSRIPELDGRINSPEILADEWFKAYDGVYWAQAQPDPNFVHVNDVFLPVWENYNKSFSDDDFYTVPIGIMDYSYHRLRDDALSGGWVRADQNGYLSHVSGMGNPFQEFNFFAAAALVDTLESDTIHWEIDSSYIFRNRTTGIAMLEVDFDDGNGWTRVSIGQSYDIAYVGPREIHIKVRLTDTQQVQRYGNAKFFNTAAPQQRGSNSNPDKEWVETVTGNVSGNTYKGKAGIWFSCHNTSGKVRKPAIFVTGFNPIPKSFKKFYDQFNASGLYTELRNEGWDVIIVKWSKGVGYIEDNAEALIKIIDRINDEKQTHHDAYFENVITGYSQGGLIARYCLAWMEKDYMDGYRSTAHHCRTYFSYEGEHQGANTLLGTQLAIQGLLTTTAPLTWGIGYIIISTAHGIYGSKAARELTLYHRSQMSSTPGQGQDPLRTNFMNSMLGDFNHSATHAEKHGYPAFSRIVGVASGSSAGTKFPLYEGQKYFQKTFGGSPSPFGQLTPGYTNRLAYYALDRDPNSVVYQKFYGIGWLGMIIPIVTITRKTNGALPYDNAPGGVEGKGQHNRIAGFINLALLYPLGGTNISNEECFTPTISVYDIRNHNGGPELGYNVQTHNLFRTSPGVSNSNYGYPHIEHGANRFDYTPFDALAGTVTNDEHVKPEPGVLKNFMIGEITPQFLYLQNGEIGKHHTYYRADFEARQEIILGKEVTWSTEREKIKVLPSGDLRCMAVNSITMEPGFEAEYGSYYDAYIGTMSTCTHKKGEDEDPEVISRLGQKDEGEPQSVKRDEIPDLKVYPNPSTGMVKVELPYEGNWDLKVYDLHGRQVWEQQAQLSGTQSLDLADQAKGIYYLVLMEGQHSWQHKIVLE